ncbi:MAG: hypothetical protein GXO48_01100 [Chlorobi bacterium]|nr:hypothetical protein [Chlorobiota bacterium]
MMAKRDDLKVVPFVIVGYLVTDADDIEEILRQEFNEEDMDNFARSTKKILFKDDANVSIGLLPVPVPPFEKEIEIALDSLHRMLFENNKDEDQS